MQDNKILNDNELNKVHGGSAPNEAEKSAVVPTKRITQRSFGKYLGKTVRIVIYEKEWHEGTFVDYVPRNVGHLVWIDVTSSDENHTEHNGQHKSYVCDENYINLYVYE